MGTAKLEAVGTAHRPQHALLPLRRPFRAHRWLHNRFMIGQPFVPREGGVKVVFDVQEDVVAEREHLPGGAATGWVRLGAEPMHEFTEAEQQIIFG
jgi:hypothetical protein